MPEVTPNARRLIDLKGMRFGRWVVLEHAGRGAHAAMWRCRCTGCGREQVKRSDNLRKRERILCDICDRDLIARLRQVRAEIAAREAQLTPLLNSDRAIR